MGNQAITSYLQYKESQEALSAQGKEFNESEKDRRSEEKAQEQSIQNQIHLQQRENTSKLKLAQQYEREQTYTKLRGQDIQQQVINSDLNNQYYHAASDTQIQNLAGKIDNTAALPDHTLTAFNKANRTYNEADAIRRSQTLG